MGMFFTLTIMQTSWGRALCVENGLIGLSDLAQLADWGKLR